VVEKNSNEGCIRAAPRPTPGQGILAASVLCGAGLAGWFVNRDVIHYFTFDQHEFTDYYWSRRIGLLAHISGGSVALTVGLIQLWLGFTGRTRRLHRWLGRIYVLGVLCGALAGIYMAATIPPPLGLYASGLVGLEIAWIITTSVAYVSIRRGAIALHREWMLRSYVVTFGFVVLRVIVSMMTALNLGSDDGRYDLAAWACWVLPLVLIQLYFRGDRRRPFTAPAQ
jgi:uncharacterized membrane protein YozB (DUF420 family)